MPSIRKCNKKGGEGVTIVVFKISDLENVNFASISTRRYNGSYGKRTFFFGGGGGGIPFCIKPLFWKKRVIILFSKTNTVRLDDRSLH